MNKLLILLIFFVGIAVAEPIVPDGEISKLMIRVVYYDTYDELWAKFPEDKGYLEGLSVCRRYLKQNLAVCELHVIRPTIVDGKHTLTIGHELMHGIFGYQYHKPVVVID